MSPDSWLSAKNHKGNLLSKNVFQNRFFSTGSVFILLAAYFCSWWYDDLFLTSLIIVMFLLSVVQDVKGYIVWQLTEAGMTSSSGQHSQTYLNRFLSWRFYLAALIVLLTPWLYSKIFVSAVLMSILMLLLVQDIKNYFAKVLAANNQTDSLPLNTAVLTAKFLTWNSLPFLPIMLFATWVYDDVLATTAFLVFFILMVVQDFKGYVARQLAQDTVSEDKNEA